ncbi:MAG: hypothetical protein ACREIT_02155 [Tepidisphaeraceae bacterium]
MRHAMRIAAALCLGLLVTVAAYRVAVHVPAAQAKDVPATSLSTQPSASDKPVNKFCPIESDHPIDPEVTYTRDDGVVVGFCCEECIEVYKKDPGKYKLK